jgi:hypothetical protein
MITSLKLGVVLLVLASLLLVQTVSARDLTAKQAARPAARYFLAPNGSDSGSCSRSRPCRSLGRAYSIARPGQIVQVAGGTYEEGQRIRYSSAKQSAKRRVVFRAAPGTRPVIGSLEIEGGQHVSLIGLDFRNDLGMTALDRDSSSSPRATDILVQGGRIQSFHITSVKNVTIAGNEIGNYRFADGFGSNSIYADNQGPSKNVLIQNNVFHNIVAKPATHAECLFVKSVSNLRVRGNRMLGCPGLAIAIYDLSTGRTDNITIENNFMQCGNAAGDRCYGGAYVLEASTKGSQIINNLVVRFNTALAYPNEPGGLAVLSGGPYQGHNRMYGNLAGSACVPRDRSWWGGYNVVTERSGTCPNNRVIRDFSGRLVAPVTGNFHLTAGSPAIRAVPAGVCKSHGCPARDIDGQKRNQKRRLDAGADERK